MKVIRANTWLSRAGGLLVRPRLNKGEALWLNPCCAIHTFGMTYPIAVFFLNHYHHVIDVRPCVKPNRVAYCRRAHSVCEMLAMTIDQTEFVSSWLTGTLLSNTAT